MLPPIASFTYVRNPDRDSRIDRAIYVCAGCGSTRIGKELRVGLCEQYVNAKEGDLPKFDCPVCKPRVYMEPVEMELDFRVREETV